MFAGGLSLIAFTSMLKGVRQLEWFSVLFLLLFAGWLTGAIGLFFNSRLAWLASLLGAGLFLTVSICGFCFAYARIPQATDPTDGIGYALVFTAIGFILSLFLTFGLFRIRKSCFQKPDQLPVN